MAATDVKFSPGVQLPHSLYLDSSILVSFLDENHAHHVKSSQFVVEALASKTKIYLSSLVFDEVWHVLMCCWHTRDVGSKFKSKNKNHIQLYGTRIQQVTEKLLKLFQPVLLPLPHQETIETLQSAMWLLVEEKLAPRDCFHLAYTITSEVDGFVTMDSGFSSLNSPALTLSIVNVL